ncbi:hypothetical protein RRG08_011771 [Elysia crispata]|uniref:Uncharacterized protein n=1 Tax=Elysia crispata TaxID=231223 RepID=A0AAE0ZRS2_9GAST|nr:hypothetical protein RRG08_011771 [Elysia crispata]
MGTSLNGVCQRRIGNERSYRWLGSARYAHAPPGRKTVPISGESRSAVISVPPAPESVFFMYLQFFCSSTIKNPTKLNEEVTLQRALSSFSTDGSDGSPAIRDVQHFRIFDSIVRTVQGSNLTWNEDAVVWRVKQHPDKRQAWGTKPNLRFSQVPACAEVELDVETLDLIRKELAER